MASRFPQRFTLLTAEQFDRLIEEAMGKILIIKHGALGDLVLALGTMQVVKREHPEDEVWLLTTPGLVSLARQSGIFTGIIEDGRSGFFSTMRVLRRVLQLEFSKIYDFQQTQRSRTYRNMLRMMLPAGAYEWVETTGEVTRRTLVKRCRLSFGHCTSQPMNLVWEKTDLRDMHGEGKYFDRLPEKYVLLIPGCSARNAYKRWSAANYGEIADRLAKLGISSVILGTQAETAEGEAICSGREHVVNMIGLTSLSDVPQVALRSLATLGNDTGPTHMAAMSGVFTIGLFDRRNAASVLGGDRSVSMVSEGNVDLISVDEVWEKLLPALNV